MNILYLELLIELSSSESTLSLLKFELDQESFKIGNKIKGDEVIRRMVFQENSIFDVYFTCPSGSYQVRQINCQMCNLELKSKVFCLRLFPDLMYVEKA